MPTFSRICCGTAVVDAGNFTAVGANLMPRKPVKTSELLIEQVSLK